MNLILELLSVGEPNGTRGPSIPESPETLEPRRPRASPSGTTAARTLASRVQRPWTIRPRARSAIRFLDLRSTAKPVCGEECAGHPRHKTMGDEEGTRNDRVLVASAGPLGPIYP